MTEAAKDRGGELGLLAREVLSRGRAALRARHEAGASGREIVHGYTLLMDRLVHALFFIASDEFVTHPHRVRHRCAVVAQGGYGRRDLSPDSDVDLLFLFPLKITPYVEQVVQRVLYALWDTGITVGQALHNPRSAVRLSERDTIVKTALLDARYLCGDLELFVDFKEFARDALLTKQPRRFFEEKLAESAVRHRKYGDSVYLLQPQVKEGEGGLRDIHMALWFAKVKFKVQRFRDLVTLGVLSERDLAELEVSQDFLWRVRNSLHFRAGGHQDQLTFELQEALAEEFGYLDTPSERGVERFMRFYYLHAAAVKRFSEDLVERCIERSRPAAKAGPTRAVRSGMQIRGNSLGITSRKVFRDKPANLIRVFAETQRHGVTLSRATKQHLREHLHLIDADLQRCPEAIAAFFDILRGRNRVYETLHEMHKLGVLIHFIPEFANLLCRVQRDLYHIYTVDEHSLRGILELERLRSGEYEQTSPLLTQVMREDDKAEILFLAMLFHDIAKGQGHDHSGRGAAVVRGIAERLDLNADDAAQLEVLVKDHLLMAHLAQQRDIQDDDLVRGFVRDVGDPSTLRKLYLLTFADMKAVGPTFWNNWRDMLLGELYIRALQVFERGLVSHDDRSARSERVKRRAQRTLARSHPGQSFDDFFDTVPANYFSVTPEDRIPEQALLVERYRRARAESDSVVQTSVQHFPEWDHSEFTVCTADRPGVFFKVAGVLAAAGVNVLRARITATTDGIVLDEFRVSHVGRRESVLAENCWERVRRTLDAVLQGQADVEAMVAESQRGRKMEVGRRGLPRAGAPAAVVVDNDASADFTVLDVYTEDRIGVLFLITLCLFRLRLQVHYAKIATNVDQVLDVFYVTGEDGRKIEDGLRLEAIRKELVERLRASAEEAKAPAP